MAFSIYNTNILYMKKVLFLLLTSGVWFGANAQSGTVGTSTGSYPAYASSCDAQFSSINRSYDAQIASYNADSRLTATDREYKILMSQFNRRYKLSQAEAACSKGATHQYRSCLDQAQAINRSYDAQAASVRANTSLSTQDRNYKLEQTNISRNVKLNEALAACTY
jgi:hypothetical protein